MAASQKLESMEPEYQRGETANVSTVKPMMLARKLNVLMRKPQYIRHTR